MAGTGRPRIGVLYDPRSTFALTLQSWVRDYCDLLWILDAATGGVSASERKLLPRLGTVVDITGADADEAAATVGAHDPSGIVTFADRRIRLAAALAAALGLPGISADTAEHLVSKFDQRAAFARAGIAVPRVWRVPADTTGSEAERVAREARMPVVCKPEEGDGSSHIHSVADVAALRSVLADAAAAGRDVVVEEYLRGAPPPRPEIADYLSVESVVSRGRVQHVALNGRFPVAWPFRETGFFVPAVLPEREVEDVLALATAAIEALGIDVGCTHTEIKLTPDGPRVIEVNGRLGGGVPEMVHLVTGVNLYEVACRVATGEDVRFDGRLECNGVAYLFYVQAPAGAGEIAAVEGLDEVGAATGVESVRLNHPPGSRVDWRAGNHDYVFSVLGVVPTHDALIDMARFVGEKAVISYVQVS